MRQDVKTWQQYTLTCLWMVATTVFGWWITGGPSDFGSPTTPLTLLILLVCTAALLWLIPCPLPRESSEAVSTKWGWFALIAAIAIAVLFALRTLVGPPLLFGLPVIAIAVLAVLRPRVAKREALYVLALALITGIAGLGAGWVSFNPIAWAVLQVLLVSTGLLAGWSILRHTGLLEECIGRSRFLSEGLASTARGFLQGIFIGMPWALGLVVLGGINSEPWVHNWWQPFTAINAGIAEEAWGRILVVPLLFTLLRRVARSRRAFITALVVVAYWFAYLHTSGGFDALFSTILTGTLYAIPVSHICLYGDLETAIGFHFWLDFVKFTAAYLNNTGRWFG